MLCPAWFAEPESTVALAEFSEHERDAKAGKLFNMMKSLPLCLLAIVGAVIFLPSCWSKPKKSGLLVVNVLSEAIYDDCHIKGSINVPFAELDAFFEVLDPDAEVVFYCSNYMCTSSGYAAKKLKEKGFKHVWAYEGGTAEWYQLGFPVEGRATQSYLKKKMDPVERDLPVISAQELAKKMGFIADNDKIVAA